MRVGTTLGRRFTLVRAEEYDLPGVERFVANDSRLNKDVTVDVVTASAPTTIKHAATKASLVRDPRIVRIITTGREPHGDDFITYVVSERSGGTQLSAVLAEHVLPPDVAGAIAGDLSRALKVAAAQGLHHGHVRSSAVTITRRGRVMISGFGVDYALATQAHIDHPHVSRERTDAVAVAHLYLSALTGKQASDITLEDLPDMLPPHTQELSRAIINGTGPTSLDDVVAGVAPFTTKVLDGFAARVADLPWQPDIVAQRAAKHDQQVHDIAAAITIEDETLTAASVLAELEAIESHFESSTIGTSLLKDVAPELGTGATAVAEDFPSLGDVTDLHRLEVMAAEQNSAVEPALWEEVLEGLHERWPQSEKITRRLAKAHTRAQQTAPINAAPLITATAVVAVIIAAMVGFSLLNKPFEPSSPRYNPPANTYPPFTFTPSPTASALVEDE